MKKTNLSEVAVRLPQHLHRYRIALITADWNPEVTHALRDGAIDYLVEQGLEKENLDLHTVPGAFELPLAAKWAATRKDIDAVICFGCIVQGETPHFEYISQACAQGIMNVNLSTDKPIIFGVLTTLDQQQALERAGGKHGNKGIEAAATALTMLAVKQHMITF